MLEHVLLPIVLAFVLFTLGRRLPVVADFYSTMLQVARKPLAMLEETCKGFRLPPASETMPNKTPGLGVTYKLVALVFGVLVYLGEFFGSLAASPVLFGAPVELPQAPWLNSIAAPSAALLLFALGAAFGICLLESTTWLDKLLPLECRIFPIPEGKRASFRAFSICGFAASTVAMCLFYATRAWFIGAPNSGVTHLLQKATICVGGPVVLAVAAVALVIVVVGLHALIQLTLGIASLVAGVAVQVIDVLERQFGRPDTRPVHARSAAAPEQQQIVKKEGTTTMNTANVTLILVGWIGKLVQEALYLAVTQMGAGNQIGVSASVNFYEPVTRSGLGEVDVSPGADHVHELVVVQSESEEKGRSAVLKEVAVDITHENATRSSLGSSIWLFIDADALVDAKAMLLELRKLRRTVVVVTRVDLSEEATAAIEGLRAMRQMWKEGAITTTIVVTANSPFVSALGHSTGEDKQVQFLAHMVASLLVAQCHLDRNPSCVEVLRQLGKRSPFTSCAFASEPLAPVRVPWFLTIGQRLFGKRLVAVGSLENMLRQGETAVEHVLIDPRYLAGPEGSDTATRYLICSMWLRSWWFDRRLGSLQQWLSNYVSRHALPKVNAVIAVSGNGVPLDPVMDQLHEHYLGCACLYTIPETFLDFDGLRIAAFNRPEPSPTPEVVQEDPPEEPWDNRPRD